MQKSKERVCIIDVSVLALCEKTHFDMKLQMRMQMWEWKVAESQCL